MNTNPVKLLTLDGGGSWAILQAMALQEIYKGTTVGTNCRSILNEFDVIAANSGGSLMLAGMIENADEDIGDVINMFLDGNYVQQIFSRLTWYERSFFEYALKLFNVGPKYRSKRKKVGIDRALFKTGNIKMDQLQKKLNLTPHLIVCGFDYDLKRATFFRTGRKNYTLSDVVNATSNAPVNYFDKPVAFVNDDGVLHRYWDGAIGGNNNPVLVGITEVLRLYGETLSRTSEDIKVLSIGTGNNLLPIYGYTKSDIAEDNRLMKEKGEPSLPRDIEIMSKSILAEPPEAANFMAHMILGGSLKDNAYPCIVRLNPLLQPILKDHVWYFPKGIDKKDHEDFISLIHMDMDAIEREEIEKIKKLGKWWIGDTVVNQSIRYKDDNFECLIGFDKFSKAKTEWLRRTNLS